MPPMSFEIEGPITFLDALSRSYLLTDLIPPAVLNHTTPAIANSPWTLMVVTLVCHVHTPIKINYDDTFTCRPQQMLASFLLI